ncbi:MAG: ATP synthase F0 subunit C [Gemmataceae bacterium]|nr:ATP synthase F0 subunit C [Gemmataceae bacterium]
MTRFAQAFLFAVLALLATATPLFAAEYAGIGGGIGMGLAVIGIGLGIGIVGYAALSGIARQPEQAGAIQGAMFILAGLIEGAGIIALVLCLALVFL